MTFDPDQLDSFDHAILRLLQRDARRTGEDLAKDVGLSAASCLRRVQRLRKIGAIQKEVAVIAPDALARGVKIVAMLTMRRGGRDQIDRLRQRLQARPEVESILHVTGSADFIVNLRCASMDAYASFTETYFYDDCLSGFESLVVLREHSPEP